MNEEQLGEVSRLAMALVLADEDVERAEGALSAAKEAARRLREEALPSAMEEVGLLKVTTLDGSVVSITPEVYASIPVDKRAAAYRWLEEHGYGGLIKSELAVAFGRDELELARKLQARLTEEGLPAAITESVHTGTLKAWLKERLAAGDDVPLETFGARPVSIAKVKLAKTRAR